MKLIREGRMPSPGTLSDALAGHSGPSRAGGKAIKKLSRAGQSERETIIRTAIKNLEDSNARAVLSDHLQDHGIPGAEIVRHTEKEMQNGRNKLIDTPSVRAYRAGENPSPIIRLRPEPPEGFDYSRPRDLPAGYNGNAPLEDTSDATIHPMAHFSPLPNRQAAIGIFHQIEGSTRGGLPSAVLVNSHAALDKAMADFPPWAKAHFHALAAAHKLPKQEPKVKPPTPEKLPESTQ